MAIATIEYYAIYGMVLFPMTLNDLSKSRYSSTLNNSKLVQD